MPSNAFDRILARQSRWQRFRIACWVKWAFFKLDLAGAGPFLSLDEQGNEYLYCKRPRIGRLLFRHTDVLGLEQPIPSPPNA